MNEVVAHTKKSVFGSAQLRAADYAASMGEVVRGNSTVTAPSSMQTQRKWKSKENFETDAGFRLRPDEYERLVGKAQEIALFENRVPTLKPLLDVFTDAQVLGEIERKARLVESVDCNGISFATGRRKSCICRVWMRPAASQNIAEQAKNSECKAKEEEEMRFDFERISARNTEQLPLFVVNGRPLHELFVKMRFINFVAQPFAVTNTFFEYAVYAQVCHGGPSSQAQALRYALSHALVKQSLRFAEDLEAAGFLRVDPRRRERKKYGRPSARARYQWCKR